MSTQTQEERNALASYLKEIRRFPLLDREQMFDLAKTMERGRKAQKKLDAAKKNNIEVEVAQEEKLMGVINSGQQASDALISANLRLVVPIASRFAYWYPSMSVLDLIQEGNTGLLRAVQDYDWRRKTKFDTYATWWVKNHIKRAINNQAKTVRVPGGILRRIQAYEETKTRLFNKLNRKPLAEEIAWEMGLDIKAVEKIRRARAKASPLDEITDNFEKDLPEFEQEESNPESSEINRSLLVDKLLHKATPRERKVLLLRFGLGGYKEHTLQEAGQEVGVTKERVRQIQAAAIKKLQKGK